MPVRPPDLYMLEHQVDGFYLFDVVVPFGYRSYPFLFCMVLGAFSWIFENYSRHFHDPTLHGLLFAGRSRPHRLVPVLSLSLQAYAMGWMCHWPRQGRRLFPHFQIS